MTPDTQNDCLNRCLALQSLVGWPEWTTAVRMQSLRYEHGRWAWCGRDLECRTPFAYLAARLNPEALCIWQDHLLRWLAEQVLATNDANDALVIDRDEAGWEVVIETGGWGACRARSADCPTLIEALLDVGEQIQKEQKDA